MEKLVVRFVVKRLIWLIFFISLILIFQSLRGVLNKSFVTLCLMKRARSSYKTFRFTLMNIFEGWLWSKTWWCIRESLLLFLKLSVKLWLLCFWTKIAPNRISWIYIFRITSTAWASCWLISSHIYIFCWLLILLRYIFESWLF